MATGDLLQMRSGSFGLAYQDTQGTVESTPFYFLTCESANITITPKTYERVNNIGAVAGMLSGLIFTLVYIFLHKGWFFVAGTNSFADTVDGSLFGIQSTAIGAVGALINFGVAYAVSMSTADTPQEIKDLVESVRVPAGAGAAVDH